LSGKPLIPKGRHEARTSRLQKISVMLGGLVALEKLHGRTILLSKTV